MNSYGKTALPPMNMGFRPRIFYFTGEESIEASCLYFSPYLVEKQLESEAAVLWEIGTLDES